MDLQLAYLAAPASAAAANAVQQGPEAASQAVQAAFAAQVEQRQETIEETQHAEGTKIRPDREGGSDAGTYSPRKRRRAVASVLDETEAALPVDEPAHFIDTTA
ncbi:MAG TPA: hypothetical protein VFE36_09915 [Candidatus Baltobacteraceae bacterium]|nr:hypothetical protein [Candidatus Baltobacteraceae bacterium]